MNKIKLSDLNLNEEAIIKDILITGNIRRRLQDIGVTPGTNIKCVLVSPFKNPKAYLIKGSVIAIREEETSLIIISKEDNR